MEFGLELSDIIILAIHHDILKVSISRYFVVDYYDIMPVHLLLLKNHLLCR